MASGASIKVSNLSLSIPIYEPGSMKLFRRGLFKRQAASRTGGNLHVSSGKIHVDALQNISFAVESGEKIGLLGHNGSGKTTLLKVLAGIYPHSSGEMLVLGQVGAMLDTGSVAIDDLNGYECVKLFCDMKNLSAVQAEKIFDDVVAFSELGEFINLPVRTYSAGMRSRLAATIITSFSYEILLIDEGIGAGDDAFQKKLQKRVAEYLESSSIVFVASHSEGLIREYCNRCMVMRKGVLVFDGSVDAAFDFYNSSEYM
jgi:lipopolysaccharide transport system ATP-binding protein